MDIEQKLAEISAKFHALEAKSADSAVIADQKEWQKIVKEMAEIEPVATKFDTLKKAKQSLADTIEVLRDGALCPEEKELFAAEQAEQEQALVALESELKELLIPKDPNDQKNTILEIRAGTGGEEAGLFGGDLLRMYLRYAERHRFTVEILENSSTGLDGVKNATILVKGKGAYSKLKFEGGVHRVQRVPETESSGRVHTSAATVAVLPEAEDVEIEIDPAEVRVDVFRSSGNGGQSVNTTDSAVRLTHEPTGIVVSCQDEKSQIKNKDKAFKVLKARLFALKQEEENAARAGARKSMVGSGDRSERIRTYNFPQGRITDHRIGLTKYNLPEFLDGDMDEIINALTTADRAEHLQNG